MKNQNSNRMDKINEELKREISHIITFDVKDPHLTGLISVTKVKTSPDLKMARVYISIINEKNRKESLRILKKSSGYIRSEVAKKLNLRYTPELIFEFDETIEYGARIDELLKNVMKKDNNEN